MLDRECAEKIVQSIGGKENINDLQHCATRLRFQLNDASLVDINSLEEMKEVLRVINKGNYVQVVIGPAVGQMYKEIISLTGGEESKKVTPVKSDTSFVSKIFDILSGAFTPLLPCLAGVGILKAMLLLLAMLGIMSEEGDTYILLSSIQNAFFYFLPILLGFTLSRKLDVNPYIGATIGAALIEPTIINMAVDSINTSFLGIPIVSYNYSSTVFPVLIAIVLYSFIYKWLDRVIPKAIHIVVIPFVSLVVVVPLTFIVFGPIGIYVAQFIAEIIEQLMNFNALIAGAVIGALWLPLVLTGLHWALIPILFSNVALGGDPIFACASVSTFSVIGVATGAMLRTKDVELKGLLGAALVPAIFAGITEPVLYGLLVRYKRAMAYTLLISAVAGSVVAMFGVKAATIFWSIISLNVFTPVMGYLIGGAVAAVGGFLLVYLLGFENKEEEIN